MDRMVIEALKHRYEADKADAREVFKTSDIMEDIDDALHRWSVADRRLQDIQLIEWELEDDAEEEEPTLFDSLDKQKWRTRSGKPSTQVQKQPGSDIYRKRPLRHSPRRSTLLRLARSVSDEGR